MISEAKKRAQSKYDRQNTRQFVLKLNLKHDADVISQLENTDNRQGYIKDLIRTDMKTPGQVLQLDSIRRLILPAAKQYELESVALFGSYSRNEANEGSDVDLLINGGNYEGLFGYLELQEELENALGKKVDLITGNALKENTTDSGIRFKNNIERDMILIYERNKN